uniref:DNA primase n=1 Tax=Strongyloides stercoralis TaxID=6248 RepID=A0A0K0E3H9_STRER
MGVFDTFSPECLPQFLSRYYLSVFPAKILTKWLTYGKDLCELFGKREIVFIINDGVHLRYRSFAKPIDFYKELCRLSPEKLDIGGVYNYSPKDHNLHSDFKVVEREFVIDIDLTDYDDVRTCCSEASVCNSCWRFAIIAVRVLENVLKNHFGFKNFIFLFSGRRGIHCWVADEIARRMNNIERSGIVSYLTLTKNDFSISTPSFSYEQYHPLINETIDIILNMKTFDDIMLEQNWLDDEKKFVEDNFCEPISDIILKSFEMLDGNRKLKWKFLKDFYYDKTNKENNLFTRMFNKFILKTVYPRMDGNVSSSTNHLLKSPFCVHPKTGRVAVPLDLEKLESIKLENFPTINKLVSEVQENCNSTQCNIDNEAYKTTSLGPYVKLFEDFVNKCVDNQ